MVLKSVFDTDFANMMMWHSSPFDTVMNREVASCFADMLDDQKLWKDVGATMETQFQASLGQAVPV